MSRRARWLPVVLCGGLLFALGAEPWLTHAQAPGRGRRFATKPGEIITPPDFGERWTDRLEVGGTAPEFTLPRLPKTANDAGQVSLRELRAKRPVVLIFGSCT